MRTSLLVILGALGLCATASAIDTPNAVLGHVYIDNNCNGVIDSSDVPVNGAYVNIRDTNGNILATSQTGEFGVKGLYGFPSNMGPLSPIGGTQYQLKVVVPTGYRASNVSPGPYSVKVSTSQMKFTLPSGVSDTYTYYDFLICRTCNYVTYTQCDWDCITCGNNGCGNGWHNDCDNSGWGHGGRCGRNTGCCSGWNQCGWGGDYGCGSYSCSWFNNQFASVYGNAGVTIGGANTLTFSSVSKIGKFLPQNGNPKVLTSSATNPTGNYGSLSGELLALELSVDFSDAGATTAFLGDLDVATGQMDGYSVRQVLQIGNLVLGGDLSQIPAGMSISDLTSVIRHINQNFDGGDTDRQYLVLE